MQVYQEYQAMSEKYNDFNLTPQAELLLEALREADDWINRSKLARRTGKSALNKWDIILLDKLADAGLMEARQIPRRGPISYEWQYRAVQIDQDVESMG